MQWKWKCKVVTTRHGKGGNTSHTHLLYSESMCDTFVHHVSMQGGEAKPQLASVYKPTLTCDPWINLSGVNQTCHVYVRDFIAQISAC